MGVIRTAQLPPSSNTHQVHQSHQHLPPPAVNGFSPDRLIQPSPPLTSSSATPFTTASDTLLITPTALPAPFNTILKTQSIQSALPALNPAKQIPIHPPPNASEGAAYGLSSNTIASRLSVKAAEELRNDIEQKQAAVSLKDVVAKQRSKKRLADYSFLSSQGSVTKKVCIRFMRYTSISMRISISDSSGP